MKYPQRHTNHSLEEKSVTFFRHCIPEDWNINSIDRDYGKDLNLEIAEDGMYKGLDLIIQLKASQAPDIVENFETQRFKISTFNYLIDNLRVVMIIKYIESENEAYWMLLKNVDKPNQENEMFTIYIPRENKISNINWSKVVTEIRETTQVKLAAKRKK